MMGQGWRKGRRGALVAALALVALSLSAAAQEEVPPRPTDLEYKPLAETLCYTCHFNWPPPLKAMAVIVPPPTTAADVGAEFEWTVTFLHGWNPKPSVPHIVQVNPSLDITNAPSLRFGGAPPPIEGNISRHSIVPVPTAPTEPQSNVTRIHVDAGATFLNWTVRPVDTSARGPVLTLIAIAPNGNETRISALGPGQAVHKAYDASALQELGSGNWTVGAEVVPVETQGGLPQLARVDFELRQDTVFDTESLKVLAFPREAYIPGGGRALQRWVLKFVAEPGPGEHVVLSFDAMAWYKHKQPVTGGDFGAIAHTRNVTLGVADGKPALVFEESAVAERPRPVNGPTMTTVSEAVGYASAFLLVSSIVSGGMFGQASRRGLNAVFRSAKRRVAFHNFLSYGLTVAAIAHMAIFLIPMVPGEAGLHRPSEQFQWTLGIIWGGIAILAMFALGVTGAFQVPMIRKWGYPSWKWWHYGLTVAAILFTVVHILLDGAHFPELQGSLGWKDPFYNPEAGL